MIDRVFICGVRRGPELVSAIDINQMSGRCGRSYNISDRGIVTLYVSNSDRDVAERMFMCDMPEVKSQMMDLDQCSLHIIPNIVCGDVHSKASAEFWFSRSLAYFQGKRLKFDVLFKYLIDNKAIKGSEDDFCCTKLGEICSLFYYGPEQINILYSKLEELVARDLVLDECCLSWCLAYPRIGEQSWRHLQGEIWDALESGLSSRSLVLEKSEQHRAFCYYCLFNGTAPRDFRHDIMACRSEAGRVFGAMKKLSVLYNFGIEDELLVMETRMRHGVSFDVAKFMLESGVKNKIYALKFMEFGIVDKESLKDRMDYVRGYGDLRLVAEAERLLR